MATAALARPTCRLALARPPRPLAVLRAPRLPPATARHHASMPSRAALVREMDRASRRGGGRTREPSMSQMQSAANAEYFRDGGGPLFPGTFVPLPLSRSPKTPTSFARYQTARLRSALLGALSLLTFKLKSMPSWTSRPRWRPRRRLIAPAAKALHRDMLEAFAAGDKPALRRICLADFAARLCAAVDRRDPRRDGALRFDLLRYSRPWAYPRLVSHQIHQLNPHDGLLMTEQAVVAVASAQKAWRVDARTGEALPGSLRMQDEIEYVVLARQVSARTFEASPWRLWGTTKPTTLDDHLREKAVIDREQARRTGWERLAAKKQ